MIITFWGVRGSLACSGPEVVKYGGNTACVEIRGTDDTVIILDAGTGIRRVGTTLGKRIKRVNILLTHLHLDHIQGLGFFTPLFDPDMEVYIYAPAISDENLFAALTKYLSPPLFPVFLHDLPCSLHIHRFPHEKLSIGEFQIYGQQIVHPGLTLGYRLDSPHGSLAYLPDHELTLGETEFSSVPEWTSGYDLVEGVDLLIHDAQYTLEEYKARIGWGHSTIEQALEFSKLAKVKTFISFHHDPSHNDHVLDAILDTAIQLNKPNFKVYSGQEGMILKLINKTITITTNTNIELLSTLNGICETIAALVDDIINILPIFLSDEMKIYKENIYSVNEINNECIHLKQKIPILLLSEIITADFDNPSIVKEYLSNARLDLERFINTIENNMTILLRRFRENHVMNMEEVCLDIFNILTKIKVIINQIELSQLIAKTNNELNQAKL